MTKSGGGELKTATLSSVAEANRAVIVATLREHGPMSRKELTERTGLSTATVNRLVGALRASRLVTETELGASTGGRPPQIIQFNAAAQSVLAFDIGAKRTTGAIVDLENRVLHREEWDNEPGGDGSMHVYERLLRFCGELSDRATAVGSPAGAIGVSVPGVVRDDTGMVEFAPALRWWSMPIGRLLAERIGLPVLAENNVNVLALAEHRHGAGRGVDDLAMIVRGAGVGAGLILGGRPHRGFRGGAGEIGYMLMEPSSLDRPWPGYGDLDLRLGLETTAPAHDDGGREAVTPARDGLVDQLALAVANLSVVVSPELVVLGGALGDRPEALATRVSERLVGRIPTPPRIVVSRMVDAGLIGAAEMAMEGIPTQA
ncbi:ROK family protein [Nonomuraea sp. NBC_01738]|uniref:ROK family transcriptional regulator n=1 Tax=Nonomuraea sp. NBC_01738 TaxID=2976003 RepID=UPI002E164879|nr:ROK family protein [Nonomuraea sp. NBC_01738]